MTIFTIFFAWLQILNLPASLQNNNTRVGPFPWKWSVMQNPDRERTNQNPGICLRLSLPYNNKHLMTGPEGNSEFCFPRISMFPETKWRETLRFEGNKIHCSPRDQSLSDLLYSKTKQKQILSNALRFQQQRSTFRG